MTGNLNRRYMVSSNAPTKQKGIALISVMLVVALCVIIATQLVNKQRIGISQAENLFNRQQALFYAKGSESFVKALLSKTLKDSNGVAELSQSWATEGMSFPVSNGVIEGQITDAYSCFNVNGLWKAGIDDAERKKRRSMFVRLLESLEVSAEISNEDLANNVYDWIDEDDYAVEAIGYDGDMYASLTFPYLSANSALAHENELRVVYGFDPIVYNQIKKHVCAIPQHHEILINVNTIKEDTPEFLMAMLDVDEATAVQIISQRPQEGFKDITEFWNLSQVQSAKNVANIDRSNFTVSSKVFRLITNATYNDVKFALTSLIQFDDSYQASVIGRRFGGEVERKANPEDEQP